MKSLFFTSIIAYLCTIMACASTEELIDQNQLHPPDRVSMPGPALTTEQASWSGFVDILSYEALMPAFQCGSCSDVDSCKTLADDKKWWFSEQDRARDSTIPNKDGGYYSVSYRNSICSQIARNKAELLERNQQN